MPTASARPASLVAAAGLTALLVAAQHVAAAASGFTFWGPYGAGGEEIPPLDVASSAQLLGAGTALAVWIAVTRLRLAARPAALVVGAAAAVTAVVALVLQGIERDDFDGELTWRQILLPHAVTVVVAAGAGAWAAARGAGSVAVVGVLFLWPLFPAEATLGATGDYTLTDVADLVRFLATLGTGVLVWHLRRRGVRRGALAGALGCLAALPLLAFGVAREDPVPDPSGFAADEGHVVALVLSGLSLVSGAIALLTPGPAAPTRSGVRRT